jgi:hypothetical protein
MVAYGGFDSEALNVRQAALDQAWAALPPDRRTAEIRERMAHAIMGLALLSERDPADLGLNESMKEFLGLGAHGPLPSIVIPQQNCES